MDIKVYQDPNYPPRPPVNCPRPQRKKGEPYTNPISGEVVRNGDEYITGPLRLILVYKTEDKHKWGFYYQSLFDLQHLHAEEEEKVSDDRNLISTHTSLIEEEEVLAQFMSREGATWIDKDFDRWVSLTSAARDVIRHRPLPVIKTTMGPGFINCPYLHEQPVQIGMRTRKAFGVDDKHDLPEGFLV